MRAVPTRHRLGAVLVCVLVALLLPSSGRAQTKPLPSLTGPVNDFANVIDADSRATLDRISRSLQRATGDALVVATIPTFSPDYADIKEYAVKLFENGGRGIGDAKQDNGALILLSVNDRKVWIEVGYGLEGAVTDGFAGSISRDDMVPHFRQGAYGPGLVAGMTRLASRVAQERGITLDDLPRLAERPAAPQEITFDKNLVIALIVVAVILSLLSNRRGPPSQMRGRRGDWTTGGWSGWSGGGSFGGGSFGGGFGGFGGGGSGGGGGGASW